jgi:hypothetical protein
MADCGELGGINVWVQETWGLQEIEPARAGIVLPGRLPASRVISSFRAVISRQVRTLRML